MYAFYIFDLAMLNEIFNERLFYKVVIAHKIRKHLGNEEESMKAPYIWRFATKRSINH